MIDDKTGASDSEKEGCPDKKAASRSTSDDSNPLCEIAKPKSPDTPRKRRCLAALLDGPVIRYELDEMVGTNNAPEYVSRLRMDGWDILTERVSSFDRDGRKISHGLYSLVVGQKKLAMEVCNGSTD